MSIQTISCRVCGQDILEGGELKDICSTRCRTALKDIQDVEICIRDIENTQDKRIFFYDVGFGDICDRYCILLLRLRHQKSLADKNESDRELRKLWDCIKTKINRSVYHPDTKRAVGELMVKLFVVNSNLWRLRDSFKTTNDKMAAFQYFFTLEVRDEFRQQLDLLVEGKSKTIRVYPT